MSLSPAEIDALIEAAHGDPFAALGPHVIAEDLWIRALLPGAVGVEVLDVDDAAVAELAQIHPAGLFEGELGEVGDRPLTWPYRLRVHYPLGHVVDVDDPYRFASSVGELDRHLLGEGKHLRPWQVLGAHVREQGGVAGVRFCVWAPNAARVSVVGSFNDWDGRRHPMRLHPGAGVWELFVPGLGVGALYKYELRTREGAVLEPKADPYAFASQLRPDTASVVAPTPRPRPLPPERIGKTGLRAPVSIYEVHLGSWRRPPDTSDSAWLSWDELAAQLPAYVAELGFTHVELLPCAEHPFDGSWGYQVTGMYAPTRRFGDPSGLATLVDACHAAGLGVILDWVPAHFPSDPHALAQFDGTALYEYADPREGFHGDWDTLIYNFARNEVQNFLVGSALYWLECYAIDGLRVDAVASMLYRDYSRAPDEWIPNVHGGRENLEAIALLQRINEVVRAEIPGAVTIAEESTAWPGVSHPVAGGGLGFAYKWDMGWMHDTLGYMAKQPIHRRHHHAQLSFASSYAKHERFILPLSHDEVVHGKGSLIAKMPGDRWQQFANLRAYLGYMWTHPGKKLLFMGGEFAQVREWNHDRGLDWELLDAARTPGAAEHRGISALIRELNRLYRAHPALHELDCEPGGLRWIEADDASRSVYAYLRLAADPEAAPILVVCNFTPTPRGDYRVGMREPGAWTELLNTDARRFCGSGVGNGDAAIPTEPVSAHGQPHSLRLTLPPLATILLAPA